MFLVLGYVISFCAASLQLYLVVHSAFTRAFRKYLVVNIFVLLVMTAAVADYVTAIGFGEHSLAYRVVFFSTDSAASVLAYLVIMGFYERILRQLDVSKQIRRFAGILLILTAAFSYLAIYEHRAVSSMAFAYELEQNLNFVGLVLVYVLWAIMLKLRETSTRLIQLVLAFGVYFSGTAGLYALVNLFPRMRSMQGLWLVSELMSAFLPLAWAYTFTFVGEEARMVPKTVAAGAVA